MRGLFTTALLPLLAAASPVLRTESIHNDAAPVISSVNAKEIPDSYLVVFKKHVTQNLAAEHHDWVQDLHLNVQNTKTELRKRSQLPMVDNVFQGLKHTYNIGGSLMGYSGHFDEDVIEQVRRHPDVSHLSLVLPISVPEHNRRTAVAVSDWSRALALLQELLSIECDKRNHRSHDASLASTQFADTSL